MMKEDSSLFKKSNTQWQMGQITLLILLLCITTVGADPISTAKAYKANRLFIEKGLQIQCWIGSDDTNVNDWPVYDVLQSDWDSAGFSTPTFFVLPMWNSGLMTNLPSTQWSIAKAPEEKNIEFPVDSGATQPPSPYDFLTPVQKERIDDLTTICFGDEESYHPEYTTYLKAWYAYCDSAYPNVMVHNNQFGNGWYADSLAKYVVNAHPDLITYDYYVDMIEETSNPPAKDMAKYLKRYRDIALAGLDGTGQYPIGFGQYIQGFKEEYTDTAGVTQYYTFSESQLRLYYFMNWTFGGKWINWFRWYQKDHSNGAADSAKLAMLLDNGNAGNPTEVMSITRRCNDESRNFSDILVRLQSSDVRYIMGNSAVTEGKPRDVLSWTRSADPFLLSVEGEILGAENTGLQGDYYIGYFEPIPATKEGEPDSLPDPDATYFMLLNAYTTCTDTLSATQRTTVTLEITNSDTNSVRHLNRTTGAIDTVTLTPVTGSNTRYTFEMDIPGGTSELFFITNTPEEENLSYDQSTGCKTYSNTISAHKINDDDLSSKWEMATDEVASIVFEFGNNKKVAVNTYTVTCSNYDSDRDPQKWYLEGSDDASNWTTIDSQIPVFPYRVSTNTYVCDNSTGYLFYRMRVTEFGNAAYMHIGEMELFGPVTQEPIVTSDICSNSDLHVTSNKYYPAHNLFDDDIATKWSTSTGASGVYMIYHFADYRQVAVNAYSITSASSTVERDPKNWTFKASHDGETWITLDSMTNQSFPYRGFKRTFSVNNSTGYRYYIITIEKNPESSYLHFAELEMFGNTTATGVTWSDKCEGGIISASGVNKYEKTISAEEQMGWLFDNDIVSKWLLTNTTGWIEYQFADSLGETITGYRIHAAKDKADRDPKSWYFLGSNDDQNWDTLDTQVDQLFPYRYQPRTYPVTNTSSYQSYRIDIFENNGPDYIQIGEVEFLGN